MAVKVKIVLVFLLLAGLITFSLQHQKMLALLRENAYQDLEENISNFSNQVNAIDISKFDTAQPSQLFKPLLKDKNYQVFLSNGDRWIYWSSIEVNPKIPTDICDSFTRFLKSPTGYDFAIYRSYNNYNFYFINHLKNASEQHEELLNYRTNTKFNDWKFNAIPESGYRNVYNIHGDFIFAAKVPNKPYFNFWLIDTVIMLVILILLCLIFLTRFSIGFSISVSLLITIVLYKILVLLKIGFVDLDSLSLFSASYYASSDWLPSLGDLLINAIFFMLLTFVLLQKGERALKKYKDLSWLYGGVILFFNCIVFYYISSLFKDSQISFNFNQLNTINIYTFVGIVVVLIWFITLHFINAGLFRQFNVKISQIVAALLLLLLLSQVTHLGISIYLLLGLLFFVFYYLFYYFMQKSEVKSVIIVEFIVFSILVSFLNQKISVDKENDLRKFYLDEVLVEHKASVEEQLSEIEGVIADDTLILRNLDKSLIVNYSTFKNRAQQLYFNNIIKDYEIYLLAFDKDGNASFGFENMTSYDSLNKLYNTLPFDEKLNYFKQIDNATYPVDYISKYEGCGASGETGQLFILLKHKLFAAQDNQKGTFYSWIHNDHHFVSYSYAIYDNNDKLRKRVGVFDYNVNLPKKWLNKSDTFINVEAYNHYFFKNKLKNITAVVTKQREGIGNLITNFSFFVLISLITAIFVILLLYFIIKILGLTLTKKANANLNRYIVTWFPFLGYERLFLSRRIQINLISIVAIGFLFTLVVVLRFIQNGERERSSREHFQKAEVIINRLEGMPFKDILDENSRNGFLFGLSDELDNDILIYGKYGQLFLATAKSMANGKFFAPLLPFETFQKLKATSSSTLKEENSIGTMHYNTYYYSILDERGNFEGTLAIPNFRTGTMFNASTSDLVKTLVNLYAILILLGTLVVYFISQSISKPLTLLRSRLSALNLSEHNKTIVWKGRDEISQLVKQYNKTVKALEASTMRLAETEREGAWKEMAKQVAHEIKNPLTPMKLNLQHLQMSLRRGDEDVQEKTTKIAEVLLNQIDKLTKLADDFGSFARITESNPEVVDPGAMLEELVLLYDKDSEITIDKSLKNKEARLYIDKVGFERVLNNILKNAVQSLDEKGNIKVKDKVEGDFYLISIADNGKGIDPALHHKIFSPNFSTKTSGMGIGLALSKKIIENAGGQIYFISELGKGTTFFVRLPLNDAMD